MTHPLFFIEINQNLTELNHFQEPLHLSMLRTIYRQLTSTTLDCPRYGDHWQQIGFQGTDPSTDLRGVGILGLVQVKYLQES